MIYIIDYGMGNLKSVENSFVSQNIQVKITDNKNFMTDKGLTGIVLPGVGSFKTAYNNLKNSDLILPIKDAIAQDIPFLGICLGYQLLFSYSDEEGGSKGLNIFKGNVISFKNVVKIPHMGWNQIEIINENKFLKDIENNSFVYFVHSFYPTLDSNEDQNIIATKTEYDEKFISAVSKNNLFASQYHPEKSQVIGAKIIKNFGVTCENYTCN